MTPSCPVAASEKQIYLSFFTVMLQAWATQLHIGVKGSGSLLPCPCYNKAVEEVNDVGLLPGPEKRLCVSQDLWR